MAATGAPAATQPASAQGKNLLTQKWGPLPVWGWLAIITLLGLGYYFLVAKKSSSSGGPQGTPQVPELIIQNQLPPGATPPTQPPPGGGGGQPPGPSVRELTVEKDETFEEFAKSRNLSQATIAAMEDMNVIQGHGKLTPETMLRRGQELLRPLK